MRLINSPCSGVNRLGLWADGPGAFLTSGYKTRPLHKSHFNFVCPATWRIMTCTIRFISHLYLCADELRTAASRKEKMFWNDLCKVNAFITPSKNLTLYENATCLQKLACQMICPYFIFVHLSKIQYTWDDLKKWAYFYLFQEENLEAVFADILYSAVSCNSKKTVRIVHVN